MQTSLVVEEGRRSGNAGDASRYRPEALPSLDASRFIGVSSHATEAPPRGRRPADRPFLGGCERAEAPRRPDAASLDLQPLRCPRLSTIRGAIAGPGEAVRPDVVVADPPDRRVRARHAELLLDVHFRPDAMAGSDVLQSGAALGRDQLPLIEDAHRTPVAAAFPKLPAHGGELPIAEQVIEITLMGVVGRPDLLPGWLAGGLGGERWCEGQHRNEQGVAHDDLTVETRRL